MVVGGGLRQRRGRTVTAMLAEKLGHDGVSLTVAVIYPLGATWRFISCRTVGRCIYNPELEGFPDCGEFLRAHAYYQRHKYRRAGPSVLLCYEAALQPRSIIGRKRSEMSRGKLAL